MKVFNFISGKNGKLIRKGHGCPITMPDNMGIKPQIPGAYLVDNIIDKGNFRTCTVIAPVERIRQVHVQTPVYDEGGEVIEQEITTIEKRGFELTGKYQVSYVENGILYLHFGGRDEFYVLYKLL
jgi:hypothetical protein